MPVERNSNEPARLRIHVSGLVQGVNFRWFTQHRANDIGVRGWVRNLGDGSVEIIAEGERAPLEQFLDAVSVGPSSAVVESVDTQWSTPTGEFHRFEIRY